MINYARSGISTGFKKDNNIYLHKWNVNIANLLC